MAAMFAANPADQRRNEDIATASMLNGALANNGATTATLTDRARELVRQEQEAQAQDLAAQVAMEAARAPQPEVMPQEQPAQAEQPYFNQDLANQILSNVIQSNMTPTQPQQPQLQEESPAPMSGLLLSDNVRDQLMAGPNPVPLETLSQMGREFGRQIVEAKKLYNQAEQIGGEQGASGMMYAHQAAEQARAGMKQLGIDPAAYGFDSDYETARQGLADNDTRALQNVLQGDVAESSGEYYDRIYAMLRDRGFASDVAEREAHRRAESYASKRVRTLNEAFNTYGHNGQAINPLGVQILTMMADEDMEKAGKYFQQYAKPLDEYAYAKQRGLAEQQQGFAEKNMATKHKYGIEDMQVQTQLRAQLKQIDAQIQDARDERNFAREKSLMAYRAQIQMAMGGGKASSSGGLSDKQLGAYQKEIDRADTWDKEHIGQENNNPYRASANRAKAAIDSALGIGEQPDTTWGDPYNNYDDFIRLATQRYAENAETGNKSNVEIFSQLQQINPEFAESIPEEYRHPVKASDSSGSGSSNEIRYPIRRPN